MDLRSKNVTQGVERAPNRSLFYAMGYTKEELERPLIGVVTAHSEIVPGHFHLDKLTEAVKAGVRMAGGTPVMIPSIGVCDGIAMGHIGMKYSALHAPTASNILESEVSTPSTRPDIIGPPEQTTVGMFILSAPRSIPGTILSQFGTKTRPSKP